MSSSRKRAGARAVPANPAAPAAATAEAQTGAELTPPVDPTPPAEPVPEKASAEATPSVAEPTPPAEPASETQQGGDPAPSMVGSAPAAEPPPEAQAVAEPTPPVEEPGPFDEAAVEGEMSVLDAARELIDRGATLRVISRPATGRRRAGRAFSTTPAEVEADELTEDQLVALLSDPLLIVGLG